MKLRRDLSAPGLFKKTREYFEKKVTDHRSRKSNFSLADVLMSGTALFSLKFPSLLQFDQRSRSDNEIRHNLKILFGVKEAPSDTQMREVLDLIKPREIRGIFKFIFSVLQRGKLLEEFVYLNDCYLLALDGTGYFSSKEVYCENCCRKNHKDGSTTYYHQMLSGVFIHPQRKGVLPFAPEPIIQQDGVLKNDCERNASERFLQDFRREHPHLKVIVTEDGLGSNAPHIETLRRHKMSFILGCKPGDHKSLFEFIKGIEQLEKLPELEVREGQILHRFRWMNNVPLNDSNPDCYVNFLEYWQIEGDQVSHWTWMSDLELNGSNVYLIMRAGRARWAIENDTFNTLKNQGYLLEHNFGHGNQYLSVIFSFLMMLAFLIDQVQQLSCQFFQKAKERLKTRRHHWETMRFFFEHLKFNTWEEFLSALAYGVKTEYRIQYDTS